MPTDKTKTHACRKITVIINKYKDDPLREGHEVELIIMSKSKKITLYELYQEMIKRFDENDKHWEENNKRWEENNKRWEQLFKKNPSLKK